MFNNSYSYQMNKHKYIYTSFCLTSHQIQMIHWNIQNTFPKKYIKKNIKNLFNFLSLLLSLFNLTQKNKKQKKTHSNISSSTLFFSHIFFSFSLFLQTITLLSSNFVCVCQNQKEIKNPHIF